MEGKRESKPSKKDSFRASTSEGTTYYHFKYLTKNNSLERHFFKFRNKSKRQKLFPCRLLRIWGWGDLSADDGSQAWAVLVGGHDAP